MAHAVKRRFLRKDAPVGDPEHIGTVAMACLSCHRIADEVLSHAEMRVVIMEAIGRRD